MKKILKGLCSVLFSMTIAVPVDTLATSIQGFEGTVEEQKVQSCESYDYSLTFLPGDFGLRLVMADITGQPESMVIFITSPEGKIVKDAQVVTSIIGQKGFQIMRKAHPFNGAYLISTELLTPGHYRLEAEIVTSGQLLTDEFSFQYT